MEAIEFEGEVTLIAQAVSLAQERLNLVIDAFHSAIADPMLPPTEELDSKMVGEVIWFPHCKEHLEILAGTGLASCTLTINGSIQRRFSLPRHTDEVLPIIAK